MRFPVRWAACGLAGLLVGFWSLTPLGWTADSDEKEVKEMREVILKIAGSFEKKDQQGAKKQAADLSKKLLADKRAVEMEDLMHLFVLRSKKGLGVGTKAGAVMPDGIEKKIEALSDKALTAKQLDEEAKGLEEMGYQVAALAEVAALVPWDNDAMEPLKKDKGKKKLKDWEKWSMDMRDASLALAEAAQKKNIDGVKSAADRANTACTRCHDVFRFGN